MTVCRLLLASALSAVTLARPACADDPDPVFLACRPAPGSSRYLPFVILFKRLHILRAMYGDGGTSDWPGVEYSHRLIATTDQDGASITLTAGFTAMVYRDTTTHEVSQEVCEIV